MVKPAAHNCSDVCSIQTGGTNQKEKQLAKKIGTYKIPFDANGNQIDYAGYSAEMRDNFVFEDVLTYTSYSRGRSSAQFSFMRTNGTSVVVFMSDMSTFIPKMINGTISGKFTFVKRGQNYGVTFA